MASTDATASFDDLLYAGVASLSTLAPRCLGLLRDRRWVARRSERITFVSDSVVERHVRVDFAVTPPARVGEGLYAVPLFMLPKDQDAWGFELTDERRCKVAWPSSDHSAELAAAMLRWCGSDVLGQSVPREVATILRDVAMLPGQQASALLASSLEPAPPRAQAWLDLSKDEGFRRLAEQLARTHVVAVVLSRERPAPAIVELIYRQRLDLRPAGGISSFFGFLGWRDQAVALEATRPLAGSQRIELTAPAGAELLDVGLAPADRDNEGAIARIAGPAAEVSLSLAERPQAEEATIVARLRPTQAVVRRVLVTAGAATAATTAAALWAGQIHRSHSAAPAVVLLAAAAAVLGLMLLPSPHALTERLVAPVRALLLVSGAAAAAAAARAAVTADRSSSTAGLRLFLLVTALVSGAAFALLVITRPRRLGPTAVSRVGRSEPEQVPDNATSGAQGQPETATRPTDDRRPK